MLDWKSNLPYKQVIVLHLKSIACFIGLCLLSTSVFASDYVYDFKKNQVLAGFYDDGVLPNDIPHPPSPLFWTSRTKANHGATAGYERTVYHTQKYFAVTVGTSLSWWAINDPSQSQFAWSGFFTLHIFIFRTPSFSPYFVWSIAGPTLLTRRTFGKPDDVHHFDASLGERFIFQDFLGLGVQIGEHHPVTVALKLYHYSNGDLFLHNAGFDVPVVLTIGYLFN